ASYAKDAIQSVCRFHDNRLYVPWRGLCKYDELGKGVSVFEPVNEEKLFRFVAAKRGQRIGWESAVRFYRHSRVPREIKWLQASAAEVDAAVTKKSKKKQSIAE